MVSVVVCTFNPDPRVLGRCLRAIAQFRHGSVPFECVIVDNNSDQEISALDCVRAFIAQLDNATIVREPRQGLLYARLTGLSQSHGSHLIYFDDDNEPAPDYLEKAGQAFSTHPHVGVWGPGTIDVEFLGPSAPWVSQYCKEYFQERCTKEFEYACLREPWHRTYPPGTGQCVRRNVMEAYRERTLKGSCTATDRTGNSLASGGDGQIVHTAVAMGLAAGRWPGMRLRHLIPEKRCNERYLERLAYGVSASLLPATVETFPEVRDSPLVAPPSWLRFTIQSTRSAIRDRLRLPGPVCRIHDAGRVGETVGRYVAAGKTVPRWLQQKRSRYE